MQLRDLQQYDFMSVQKVCIACLRDDRRNLSARDEEQAEDRQRAARLLEATFLSRVRLL